VPCKHPLRLPLPSTSEVWRLICRQNPDSQHSWHIQEHFCIPFLIELQVLFSESLQTEPQPAKETQQIKRHRQPQQLHISYGEEVKPELKISNPLIREEIILTVSPTMLTDKHFSQVLFDRNVNKIRFGPYKPVSQNMEKIPWYEKDRGTGSFVAGQRLCLFPDIQEQVGNN
jgi:hypothetical protein